MINILFVAWNRRAYTEASFQALLDHTDWAEVDTLHIHDDGSTDGTAEYLQDALNLVPHTVTVKFETLRLGGPVAATNRHLDMCPQTEQVGAFAKIDSDFIVCPGWLPEMQRLLTLHPGVDIFGIQPRFGPPTFAPDPERTVERARHIGGIGVLRHRAFERCRPVPNGRYGFTEWQGEHRDIQKAWVTPDLPCFSLDLIGLEPWRSLALSYIANGWMRPWSLYEDGGRSYFEWWNAQVPA